MQQGRGGMGSRKHGRSGQGGPSPKQKFGVALAANEEIRRQQEARRRKQAAEPSLLLFPS